MGLEFRWQVESDEEWKAIESPPKRKRPVPWRFVGPMLVLLAVAAGIAAGVFWQRARQGEARLRRELRTAANLEAQALRDGDRETFLSLQDRDDTRWYGRRKDRVPSWGGFAYLEPGQEADLAVLGAAFMPQSRAWAEVAWALEDGLYRRVQFYRQVDGQWLRTGLRREYFGQEHTRQTAHFAFKYQARDEPTVAWMAGQLEVWYNAVCADLGCDDGRRINVLMLPYYEYETGGEYRPPKGFAADSPRLRGVREDGAPLPEEREELVQILIYLLAARQASSVETQQQLHQLDTQTGQQFYPSGVISQTQSVRIYTGDSGVQRQFPQSAFITGSFINGSDVRILSISTGDLEAWQQPYLLPQIVNWEIRRLGLDDEDTPPTPVLDAVMASHGIEGVRALLAAMGQTESEDEALRLALGLGLEDLDMVFGQYLAALLAVERQMMEWQASGLVGETTVPLARQTFNALLAQKTGSWRSEKDIAFRGWREGRGAYSYPAMPLSRPAVERWESLDDSTLWTEVSYSEIGWPFAYGTALRRVEFFQQADGAWRHAPPDERFLGEEVALNSEHFRVECHEREMDLMASSLGRLETLYRRIAEALQTGFPPGERLTVKIVTSLSYSLDSAEVRIPSPYLEASWGDLDASHLASRVSFSLFERLALRSIGMTNLQASAGSREMWVYSILSAWQWDIVAPEGADRLGWLRETGPLASAVRSGEILSLSELSRATFGPYTYTDDPELIYQKTYSVVYYVAETYGSQALPALLRSLAEADSMEDWLRLALDVDQETFEAGWQAWLREQIGQ